MSQLQFDAAPRWLVDASGLIVPGVYREPVAREDLGASRFGWFGGTAPTPARALRLKQWQHFCVISPGYLLTFAVVDAAYMKTGWVRLVDLTTGHAFERAIKGPPTLNAGVAADLWNGRTWLRATGLSVEVLNDLESGRHEVRLRVAASGGEPEIDAAFVCRHDLEAIDPLVVNLPLGRNRAMYSHKVPLPVGGRLRVGTREVELKPTDTIAVLDIHKAHYPRHTWWKWATFAGFDASGRIIGLNLTENVARQPERWTENAAWIDGRCHRLSRVTYEFDRRAIRDPWRITTRGGEVNLEFRPQGGRQERLEIGPLLRSNFDQLHGTFHGTVEAGGETLAIDGMRGLCEDHDAIW
ncbi:MAG: DUF2804 domain-containing protein [Myxococcota bacterium]